MGRARAIFVDRDGVLNELVYNEKERRALSPFSASELRVFPYVPETVKRLKEDLGFKVVVISNQPGVAKGQFSYSELQRMNEKVRNELSKNGTCFDGEYYCLHHPNAILEEYRLDCDCRKPKPGMLLRAAKEHDIDLAESYFAGDAPVDVKAGKAAGCNTILVARLTESLIETIDREGAVPRYWIPSLEELPRLLVEIAAERGVRSPGPRGSPGPTSTLHPKGS